MKRINLILLCAIFTITAQAQTNNGTTQQSYNPETGWHINDSPFYANIRVNGLQMYHTVLKSEFYTVMGGVYDSVSYWGTLMYFDRSIVQQAKEISPININRAPKYDYIDAIEVGKVAEIPMDYDGIMGVPLTFMDYYNPDQFEIIDCTNGRYAILDVLDVNSYLVKNHKRICSLNEHPKYARLLIRKKK